jgi:hypothetical protein
MITEADRGHAGTGCRPTAPGVGREQPECSGSYPLTGATAATGSMPPVCQSPTAIGTPTDRVPYRRVCVRLGVDGSVTPIAHITLIRTISHKRSALMLKILEAFFLMEEKRACARRTSKIF